MARKKGDLKNSQNENSGILKIFEEIAKETNVAEANLMDDIFDTPLTVFNELIGGIPRGRIVSVASEPGAGKTTLMVQIITHLQKHEECNIIYIDTEQSMSRRRFSELGLDIDKILYIQPQTLEDAYTFVIKSLQRKQELGDMSPLLIAFDSITATPTKKDIQSDETDFQQQVGHRARINSKAIPIIQTYASKTNTTFLMINQLRKNINIGYGSFFTPQDEIVGGLSLLYYAAVDIRLSSSLSSKNKLLESNEIDGKLVWAKTKKNRLMTPMIEFPMVLDYKNGFDNDLSNLAFLLEFDEYSKDYLQTGSWYKVKNILTGKEYSFRLSDYKQMCNDDPEFRQTIDDLVVYICRKEFKGVKDEVIFDELTNKKLKDTRSSNVVGETGTTNSED
jgi:recombination protein RecA